MASSLRFEIIKDLDKARDMWNMFTPRETIYDEWDFRYCFYKYFNYELFFYVGYVNDEPIGLLPLQWNPEKKYLEFFGGDYMEDNRVYMKKENEGYIPEFYGQIDRRAELNYIRGDDTFTAALPLKDYKYILPLTSLTDSNNYIQQYFRGETKKKMIKRIRKVAEENKIEVIHNNFEDIELLFCYNEEHFKEESSFHWPYRKEVFRDLLRPPFDPHLTTYIIEGGKKAISLALISNGVYESFNTGISKDAPKNLASYIHCHKIDQALALKAILFDAFTADYGWKEHWRFHKIPEYVFEKN
jgi:hypothetical protein